MITAEGSASVFESASATDAVIPYPAGVVAGELLVATIAVSQQSASTTEPTDWSLAIARNGFDANGPAISVHYYWAVGGETGSVTWAGVASTAGRVTGIMQRFAGVDPTTPIDATPVGKVSGVAASFSMSAITTATNNALLLYSIALNAASSADINTPAGMTLLGKSTGTGRRHGDWAIYQATAGTSGATTWTQTSATTLQWAGAVVPLRPSATGGDPGNVTAVPASVTVQAGDHTVTGGGSATVVAVKGTVTALANAPVFSQGVPGSVPVTATTVIATAHPITHNGITATIYPLAVEHTRTLDIDAAPALTGTLSIQHGRTLTSATTNVNVLGSLNLTRKRTLSISATPAITGTASIIRHRNLSLAATVQLTSTLDITHNGDLGLSGNAIIPGRLLTKRCEKHTAFLYDRGGRRQIAAVGPLARVKWGRLRDDISSATVSVKSPDPGCADALAMAEAGRMELVIFRGNLRVWEGPVVRLSYQRDTVEIEAHDVMHYVRRTIMRNEYDNRYPNNGLVLDRLRRIFTAELARWEAVDPAANVLSHIKYIYAGPNNTDAGTAAWTKPYEMTLFQHIDAYAARGGLDYTVIGRSIYMFDTHTPIGQTPLVTRNDFLGDPIITQYGMELATYVAMTDGKGNYGEAGGTDPYYGIWEALFQAYDENAGPAETNQPPSVAEMTSQALRTWGASKYPPVVVRIPDNSRINPNGALDITYLVPGMWVPLNAEVPGRNITQMQKLDNMTVEETPEKGEVITATFSPATKENFVEA